MFTRSRLAGFGHARMLLCALFAVLCLVAVVLLSPQQGPVMLYKLALVLVAAFLGYWIDRWAFPYARPDGYLTTPWREQKQRGFLPDDANHGVALGYRRIFAAAMLRRAVIMGLAMLAVCAGL